MAIRSNHYDAAFEAYLRDRRVPYVAVDEQRRSLLASSSLKSMDFIVHRPGRGGLLVEVKGRKYPSAGNGGRWENWVTGDDVESLLSWEEFFPGSEAAFVFAYDVEDSHAQEFDDLFVFRDRRYAFYGVGAAEYKAAMTRRSARWSTFTIARGRYARLRCPIAALIGPAETAARDAS